jgi:hypothetical protein
VDRTGQMDDGEVVVQNPVIALTTGVEGRISVTRFPVERHRNNGRVRLGTLFEPLDKATSSSRKPLVNDDFGKYAWPGSR